MKTFVFALAMIVVAGCHKDNNFCPGANPDNSCAEIDAKVANGCSSNATCTAPKVVCDLAGSKTCVQCVVPDDTSACTATSPVCGGDHTCRGCTAHTDCPLSDVCLPDGSCADSNVVAYVAPSGTGTAVSAVDTGQGSSCSAAGTHFPLRASCTASTARNSSPHT